MSWWPTVPGMALMIICMTGGGLIRDVVTDIYYQKPRPVNLDVFTKAMLHRDLQVYEERKAAQAATSS